MALTSQTTGWQDLTALSTFTPHSQINDAVHHAEDAFAQVADTVADLPASNNWPGRTVWVTSAGLDYTWNGSGWVASGPFKRQTNPAASANNTIDPQSKFDLVGNRLFVSALITTTLTFGPNGLLFTLPVGLRPLETHTFTIHLVSGTHEGFGWGVVNTDGTVKTGAYMTNSAASALRAEFNFPIS